MPADLGFHGEAGGFWMWPLRNLVAAFVHWPRRQASVHIQGVGEYLRDHAAVSRFVPGARALGRGSNCTHALACERQRLRTFRVFVCFFSQGCGAWQTCSGLALLSSFDCFFSRILWGQARAHVRPPGATAASRGAAQPRRRMQLAEFNRWLPRASLTPTVM